MNTQDKASAIHWKIELEAMPYKDAWQEIRMAHKSDLLALAEVLGVETTGLNREELCHSVWGRLKM